MRREWLLWIAFGYLLSPSVWAEEAAAAVVPEPSLEETAVAHLVVLRSTDCYLDLTVYKPEALSAGTIRLRRNCSLPSETQLARVSQLLDVALQRPELLAHARELAWGVPETPEERIALINAELTHPKHTRGSSMSNELGLEILRDANVFGPLIEIFKARGFKLELSSLEKVFKTQAKNLARVGVDMTKLARPVTPKTWVLDTAQAWFRIERAQPQEGG